MQINQKFTIPRSNEMVFDWNYEQLDSQTESEDQLLSNTLKSIRNNPNYEHIRGLVLPYTQLKSRFEYKDSLKIAEIDSLFNVCPRSPLSPYFPSLLAYTTSFLVRSIDIGGGPGGYTEYFQFRYVNCMTMGFTNRKDQWNLKILDPHRLIRFYGQDNTGDLLTQWKNFLQATQQQYMAGADFISATTIFDKYHDYQTFLELYLILSTIKDGANAILRMDATWSNFMKQIIYFATQCFEEVHLFQPLLSGSDSDELFLVLKHARSSRKDYFIVLQNLFQQIPKDLSSVQGFLKVVLPESFEIQIQEAKNDFYRLQSQSLFEIQQNLRNDQSNPQESIDIQLKLLEWSLPDPY